MGATDRRAQLAETVQRLLLRRVLSEDFGYDIGPVVVQGPGGITAGYMLVVSARSPVLRPARISHTHIIPDTWPDEEQLEDAIKTCCDGLTKTRVALLKIPEVTP